MSANGVRRLRAYHKGTASMASIRHATKDRKEETHHMMMPEETLKAPKKNSPFKHYEDYTPPPKGHGSDGMSGETPTRHSGGSHRMRAH